MKLDQNTSVPLGWVAGAFGFFTSVVVVGTFWVASVNFRLSRIEDRLGIKPPPVASLEAIEEARAGEENGKLPRPVQRLSAHH